MGLSKKEAHKAIQLAEGNIPKALLIYIMKNGCNGFRCKGCLLQKVCTRYPKDAVYIAAKVYNEVIKREEELKEDKRSNDNRESKDQTL